jgi:hypothetical protein
LSRSKDDLLMLLGFLLLLLHLELVKVERGHVIDNYAFLLADALLVDSVAQYFL